MTPQDKAFEIISNHKLTHKNHIRNDSLAKALDIKVDEAQGYLDKYRTLHGERVRGQQLVMDLEGSKKEEQKPKERKSIDALVMSFSKELQYIGFFIGAIVDLGLACFFLYSLGSGDLGKWMLASMGLVLTAAKLWGWTNSRLDRKALSIAIFTVALSVFGNTAILRAEFELQAKSAIATNQEQDAKQSPMGVIQKQITDKQADLDKKTTARDSIDMTVEANLPMYNTLDKKVKESSKELTELTNRLREIEKEPAKVEEPVTVTEIKLDAWTVFRQWTELDWNNAPRVLSWFFTLVLAFLPDLVIYATTPRKEKEL